MERNAPVFQFDRTTRTPRVPIFRKSEFTLLHGHTSKASECEWTPNASRLASVSMDGTARIWEFDPLSSQIRRIQVLQHFNSKTNLGGKQVTSLQWKDDGTLLATCSNDGQARIWSPDGELRSKLCKHGEGKCGVKWSKECDYILSWSHINNEAAVWDLKADECKQKFAFHQGPVLDADWFDNVSFATSSSDKVIYVCKIGDNLPIKSFAGHMDEVNSVRWDPTGSLLASGSKDRTVKIWDISQVNAVHDLEGHNRSVFAVRWSPTGLHTDNPNKPLKLASASSSIVKLWNVEQGVLLTNLLGPKDDVNCISFSPDGEYVASGSEDNYLRIWSVTEGKIVKAYPGTGSIHGVSWTRKGDRVAVCSSDGLVCILDMRK